MQEKTREEEEELWMLNEGCHWKAERMDISAEESVKMDEKGTSFEIQRTVVLFELYNWRQLNFPL